MIKEWDNLKEGDILNGIISRRFSSNQNILLGVIGKTGSGKSWSCLKICELWYKEKFKKPFPVDNCCFSIEQLMERLVNGKLQRGELLIIEEGGVNLGSLDFQNKLQKAFTYVLQSFRSMNIGILINLPYFSMLNKNVRLLMHILLKTIEIKNNKAVLKIHHLQYNQQTGKLYNHRPQIMIDGCYEPVDFITYSPASKELIDSYEERKHKFVKSLAVSVLEAAKNGDKKPLTPLQEKIKALWDGGMTNQTKIARKLGLSQQQISENIQFMGKKGWKLEKNDKNAKEIRK